MTTAQIQVENNMSIITSILRRAEEEIEHHTGMCLSVQITPPTLEETNVANVEELIDKCCEIWGIESDLVRSKGREKRRTNLRSLLCYLIKVKWPAISQARISVIFKVDHTSVVWSIKKTKDHLSVKDEFMTTHYEMVKHILLP